MLLLLLDSSLFGINIQIELLAKGDNLDRIILTTEKDAIRFYEYMPLLKKEGIEIYVLPMKMQFLANDGIFFDKLLKESIAYFKEKGIRVIHIWEDDWDLKKNIIKSQIYLSHNICNSSTIYLQNLVTIF